MIIGGCMTLRGERASQTRSKQPHSRQLIYDQVLTLIRHCYGELPTVVIKATGFPTGHLL
uniref:Uncharacterized protein n=1 Tax=Heterorhabditis bacteriophora TaxID=37862 RepID=A0A1I7WER6_HETBA